MNHRLTTGLVLGSFVGLSSPALAEDYPRPSLDLALDQYDIGISDYTFPSGLRILFQEDHSQPIVSITMVIDRGSSHDPVGKEGIAHLVEHLWFRSVHGTLPKVWDVLEEFGANLNASTASDWTNYMTVAPKDALVPLLKLEAMRLTEPVLGVVEQDVATEREIVRNELRMRYENSSGSALGYMREALYPEGHPYHRLGIGTHDSLNNINLADVKAFTDANYRPENTTIVVVGDFSLDEVPKLIQESFPMELLVDPKNPDAKLELIDAPVRVSGPAAEPPPPVSRGPFYHKAGVEKTTVILGWSLPGGYRPNMPEMQVAVNLMSRAVGSYLNPDWDPLTDSLDDLNGFGCFPLIEEVNSSAMCFIEIGAGQDPIKVAEKALDGLFMVWAADQLQFQRIGYEQARYDTMAYYFRSVESVSSVGSGRATDTAEFVHFTGDARYYSTMFEWLQGVDVSKARNFAMKYLTRERAVTVVLEPYDDDDIVTDSSDAVYKGAVRQADTITMIDPSEINADLLKGIMVPPKLTDMKEYTLQNGLRVVVMPYGTAPLARVHLVANGGSLTEPTPGLAQMVDYGLGFQLSPMEDPLRYAGGWEIASSSVDWRQGLVGSSANIEGLLYMLRRSIDEATVDLAESKSQIKVWKKSLVRTRNKDVGWWEGYVRYSTLFPGHPLGIYEDEAYYDSLATITEAQATAFFHELIQPANATLYIVGRVDPARTEAAVRTYFEGWVVEGASGKPQPLPSGPPAPPEGRRVVILNKDRVSQTGVTMACQIGPATNENLEARRMLADVLDEQAWVALREQSGATYGAGSGQMQWPGGASMLTLSSLVQNDGVGLAVTTFIRLSEEAGAGNIPQDMISVKKLSYARQYALGQQSTDQMIARISPAYREDWSHIEGKADRLAAVTKDDLQAQMQRCTGHEVFTLVGPADVIAPQLEKAGVPFEVYDWKAEADKMWQAGDPKGYAKSKKKEAKAKAKEESKKK
jgi:zinc protease